jgi:hypothetical protein
MALGFLPTFILSLSLPPSLPLSHTLINDTKACFWPGLEAHFLRKEKNEHSEQHCSLSKACLAEVRGPLPPPSSFPSLDRV